MDNERNIRPNNACSHRWILVERRELNYQETAFSPFNQTIIVKIYRCEKCNKEKKEIEIINEHVDMYFFNKYPPY